MKNEDGYRIIREFPGGYQACIEPTIRQLSAFKFECKCVWFCWDLLGEGSRTMVATGESKEEAYDALKKVFLETFDFDLGTTDFDE